MLTEINVQEKCKDIKVGDYFLYDNEIYIKSDLYDGKVSINIKTGGSSIFSETPVTPLTQKMMSFACDFKKIITNKNCLKTGDCIILSNCDFGIVTWYNFKHYIIDLFTGDYFPLCHNNYNVLPNAKIILG